MYNDPNQPDGDPPQQPPGASNFTQQQMLQMNEYLQHVVAARQQEQQQQQQQQQPADLLMQLIQQAQQAQQVQQVQQFEMLRQQQVDHLRQQRAAENQFANILAHPVQNILGSLMNTQHMQQLQQAAAVSQISPFALNLQHHAQSILTGLVQPVQSIAQLSQSPVVTPAPKEQPQAVRQVEQFIAVEEALQHASPMSLSPRVPIGERPSTASSGISGVQMGLPMPVPQRAQPLPLLSTPPIAMLPAQGPLAPAQVPPRAVQPEQHQPQQQQQPPPPPPQRQHQTPPRGQPAQRAAKRGGRRNRGVPRQDKPPRVDEALAYLRVIKQTFSDNVLVYHKFLEIMKDFRAQRINTPDVIEQVAELLYEFPDLVLGFNTFLPTGFSISVSNTRYLFTAPNAQPRLLPSPAERLLNRELAAAAAAAQGLADAPQAAIDQEQQAAAGEERREDEGGNEEVEDGDNLARLQDDYDGMEEEEEPEDFLVEEVIRDKTGDEDTNDEDDEEKEPNTLEEEAVRVIELLKSAFTDRPSKLADFLVFMEVYMYHVEYYKQNEERLSKDVDDESEVAIEPKEEEEDYEVDDSQPGPAPPPRQMTPEDEIMDTSEKPTEAEEKPTEEGDGALETEKKPDAIETDADAAVDAEKEKQKKAEEGTEQVKIGFTANLVSLLVNICEGEPQLLAATLQFLPYLEKAILAGGEDLNQRIIETLRYDPDSHKPVSEKKLAKVGDELMKRLESLKVGRSSNEKLRISKRKLPMTEEEAEKQENQELMVLNKTQSILYEHLKLRTTPNQMQNLLTLFNMYHNMELTKERLITELPKVLGCLDSEIEIMIKKMLGVYKEPKDRPENDADAKQNQEQPAPHHAKRGLRDQKTLQQVRDVQAATVCTLGPSYRLMKDSRGSDCSGRAELDPAVKEVINDTWSSYPSWSSEDTVNQTIKKSNLEEFYFKTEDERYELDIIVDSNRTVIEQLSKTLRDIERMADNERDGFELDDALNCSSKATLTRVLTKVYTNSANEMMEAAQRNPVNGLKKILDGLREKDLHWSKFQQETNRTWRDALDKQMSQATTLLNHQQKQYDQKSFKSKPLVNAIEQVYEERLKNGELDGRPHMTLEYTSEARLYRDVNDVTGHFFHDLPGGKSDKDRTKIVLFSYRILMEWLCQPGQHVQIDLDNGEVFRFQGDINEDDNLLSLLNMDGRRIRGDRVVPVSPTSETLELSSTSSIREQFDKSLHGRRRRVFYGDDNVYMLIRYHHILIERFTKILATQAVISQEHLDNQKKSKKWEEGVGADMHGRKVLDEMVKARREAVNDIRNIRASPAGYYDMTLRDLKQLGNNQSDMTTFEDTVRQLFPGDVALFNSIDKLFTSLAKNIHSATCTDEKENPIKLYLKYRQKMMDASSNEEFEKVEEEYANTAEEMLHGKNTFRFEFIEEKNVPFMNIWVIPREEKESADASQDDEDKDDHDKRGGKNGGADHDDEQPPHQPPSNDGDMEEDGDEDHEEPTSSSRNNRKDGRTGGEKKAAAIYCCEPTTMAIEEAGCDMNVAFGGRYIDTRYAVWESNPGELHRIYFECIKDHRLFLLRNVRTRRRWNYIGKGMKILKIQKRRAISENRFEVEEKKVIPTHSFRTVRPLGVVN